MTISSGEIFASYTAKIATETANQESTFSHATSVCELPDVKPVESRITGSGSENVKLDTTWSYAMYLVLSLAKRVT